MHIGTKNIVLIDLNNSGNRFKLRVDKVKSGSTTRLVFLDFLDGDIGEFMEWAADQPCTISGSTLADVIASVMEEHLNKQ